MDKIKELKKKMETLALLHLKILLLKKRECLLKIKYNPQLYKLDKEMQKLKPKIKETEDIQHSNQT